jgi:hypothetical protein
VLPLFQLKLEPGASCCNRNIAIPAERIDCTVFVYPMRELYSSGFSHEFVPFPTHLPDNALRIFPDVIDEQFEFHSEGESGQRRYRMRRRLKAMASSPVE